MNKQAILQQIYNESFENEFKKISTLSDENLEKMKWGLHTKSPGTYIVPPQQEMGTIARSQFRSVPSKIGPIEHLVGSIGKMKIGEIR